MEQDTVIQLQKINWFIELPDEIIAALAQQVRTRTLSKDEVLFNKGEEGDSLFIINSGRVKIVTHDSQGNEVILNQVEAGEIIGEMALLDFEPRSAGVVALEETSVMELSREDFMEILSGQPELALSIIRDLISRLRHNTSYIEQITEMSRRVARGDYSFLGESQPVRAEENSAGQEKIRQLMAEFFKMVQGVRQREAELKEQLQKLALQIDEVRRKQVFDEITNTDFYANLKRQAKNLRAQRKDNK
jgi:CRP/FNR family transcriptional regulator, cyclic AMP receptor protein